MFTSRDPNGAVPTVPLSGGIAGNDATASAAAAAAAAAAGIVPPGSQSSAVRSYATSVVSGGDVHAPFWDTYDTINQLYLELGNKAEMRSHYRGHKMSLWLNLIPQLHRAAGDGDDLSMRHHHFQEEGDQYYDGSVRPQTMQKPTLVHLVPPPTITTTTRPTTPPTTPSTTTPISSPPPLPSNQQPPKSDTTLQGTTECPPNNTYLLSSTKNGNGAMNSNNNLLRKLAASNHYQSYTTALTVTIAVGCFLLLLNILIFAGIYHQRDRSKSREKRRKKKEEMVEAGTEYNTTYRSYPLGGGGGGGGGGAGGSCSSSSGEGYDSKSSLYDPRVGAAPCGTPGVGYAVKASSGYSGNYECSKPMMGYIGEYGRGGGYETKHALEEMHMTQLPLQEFQSSPPSGMKRNSETILSSHNPPPPDITTGILTATSSCKESQTTTATTSSGSDVTSPSIPEPPPPPRSHPPHSTTTGSTQTHSTPPPQAAQAQCLASGILRSSSTHGGAPTTPGTMKKRVQIQEISV